jgi:hypothetical protein
METLKFPRNNIVTLHFSLSKYLLTKYLLTKYLLTKYLLTKYLLTKYLLTKYLLTKYLLTKYLLTKYLLTKYLLTKYLLTKYLLTKYLLTKYLLTKYLLTKYLTGASKPTKRINNINHSASRTGCRPYRRKRREGGEKLHILEHVARVGEMRSAYTILDRKPGGKRRLWRPRSRWEDNIDTDIQ